MDSLYRPDELLTTQQFLKKRFPAGVPADQKNIARVALTKHIHDSHHFFASNFAYVADKKGTLTTLRPFVGQAILRYTLDSQLRNELPGRVVEVKARQLGWTVENISRVLHFCLDENKRGLILVDDEDVAAEQATRLATMLNGLPGWLQPMRRIQNLKHLVLDNPNPKDRQRNPGLNSAAQITVPSSFRGIGGSICVIISEYAHMLYERQEAVQKGLVSAISSTPSTIIIYDSTPNGFDASYWPMSEEAIDDNKRWIGKIENWKGELKSEDVINGILGLPDAVESGYPNVLVPALCPWRLHEEYSARSAITPRGEMRPMTIAQRKETEGTLGKLSKYGADEEIELREKYDTCLERIWWRRRKIDGYKLPTEEMKLLTFRQEFLSTALGGFVESGATPFDRASLDVLSRMERTPSAVGLFRSEDCFEHWEMFGEPIKSVHRDRNAWQEVRIYAPPQNGEQYTMGVDTDIKFMSMDSDATVAQVVRARDAKLVCTYEARVPDYLVIQQLRCIYRWYFNCYYAVELIQSGIAIQEACFREAGMTNAHMYKRYDADIPDPTKFPGWETNRLTRPIMDRILLDMLCHRDPMTGMPAPLFDIPDAKTIQEIKQLSRTQTGSFKNERGGHDDHVDAFLIALAIAEDPFSGIRGRKVRATPRPQEQAEFESLFKRHADRLSDRNHPDLATL